MWDIFCFPPRPMLYLQDIGLYTGTPHPQTSSWVQLKGSSTRRQQEKESEIWKCILLTPELQGHLRELCSSAEVCASQGNTASLSTTLSLPILVTMLPAFVPLGLRIVTALFFMAQEVLLYLCHFSALSLQLIKSKFSILYVASDSCWASAWYTCWTKWACLYIYFI